MNFMNEDFVYEGTSIDEFRKAASAMDNHTFSKEVDTDCTSVLFCYKQYLANDIINSKMMVVYDDAVYPDSDGSFNDQEKITLIANRNLRTPDQIELLKELEGNILLNFDMGYDYVEDCFFLSEAATKTLAAKINIKNCLLSKKSFARSIFISSGLNAFEKTKIIYRSDDKYNKIIAFVGAKYKRTPVLDAAEAVVNACSNGFVLKKWKITQWETYVKLAYDNKVVKISMSDSGQFADNVTVYIQKNKFLFELKGYPIDVIYDDSFWNELKPKLDNAEEDIHSMVNFSRNQVKKNLGEYLGEKTTKNLWTTLETSDDIYHELCNLPLNYTMTAYQIDEYRKVFRFFGEKCV